MTTIDVSNPADIPHVCTDSCNSLSGTPHDPIAELEACRDVLEQVNKHLERLSPHGYFASEAGEAIYSAISHIGLEISEQRNQAK